MSNMSQHFMALPEGPENGLCDDPDFKAWSEKQDKSDQKTLDADKQYQKSLEEPF